MGLAEEKVSVRCYSGRTYAERPMSFRWQDTEYEVIEIVREWLEPGERHFYVRTQDNRRFHLQYNETQDDWALISDD